MHSFSNQKEIIIQMSGSRGFGNTPFFQPQVGITRFYGKSEKNEKFGISKDNLPK